MFDPAARHHKALAARSIATIAEALTTLNAAVADCEKSRHQIDQDPAVLLLARHIGCLALEDRPEQAVLRTACMEAISALGKTPMLIALAKRGVSYDADAKATFHAEGRKAIKRLAAALGLARGSHQVRFCQGGIAVAGEIILHSDQIYVQLSIGLMGRGHDVMFRRVEGRNDYTGGPNHWASIDELLDPDTLATRIRHELRLDGPADLAA
ncbi:hypothetical protein D2V17_16510 [Aurantiacibacter xanthus]|jgi:hypothetical protein|uniref:Uncharacterized protein n=1 Tax=Aurantiacibacter xanthus TaxID=1784712 RepID=A0A3A1P073_9SPHN|nr:MULTISPECIES: hypothetical protein [Sphingomonadales]RIV81865.1 hypothetical protein D2V17_16510 [Aurantiacibacter xanthus]|tara:strand:- start:99 stop:731 length:633 start_codon:yes stop_codon:yes gene_type:complete